MSDQPLNLVAIGATGVGKSTFLNYLLDREEFSTSDALPTTAKGFWHKDTQIRGFPIHVIDSWGLEAGKSNEWILYLKAELEKRGLGSNISEWFHGVCYLIAATGNRVQPFDQEILGLLISEGYSVVVVLTKAAKVDEETISSLKSVIASAFGDTVPVVAVNSKTETLRDGHVVQRFGIDEFEQELVRRFWETIRLRIPRRIGYLLECEVATEWDQGIIEKYLDNLTRWHLLSTKDIQEKLKSAAEELKYNLGKKCLSLRDSEVATAKKTYKALAQCLDIGSSWEMSNEIVLLEAKFECSVEDPHWLAQIGQFYTLGLYDATTAQRNGLKRAARVFSEHVKKDIRDNLVPKVSYSIQTIRINPTKLAKRGEKGSGSGFFAWLRKFFTD